MKKIKFIAILYITFIFLIGCDDTQPKFSGSPVGTVEIVNLVGTISTEETVVCANQLFKITATIPQTFDTNVNVEAVTETDFGSKRRGIITILAGQTSGEGKISAPSAVVNGNFLQSMKLRLSAIVLATPKVGTIYAISSENINMILGETTLPVSNSSRCIIKFDWQGPWGSEGNPLNNNMDLVVKLNGVDFNQGIPPATIKQNIKSSDRDESFSIVNSFPEGLYTFEAVAKSLNVPGFESLPYRFVVVFPDDSAKTFQGNFIGLTAPSAPIEKLKILKGFDTAGNVTYKPVL